MPLLASCLRSSVVGVDEISGSHGLGRCQTSQRHGPLLLSPFIMLFRQHRPGQKAHHTPGMGPRRLRIRLLGNSVLQPHVWWRIVCSSIRPLKPETSFTPEGLLPTAGGSMGSAAGGGGSARSHPRLPREHPLVSSRAGALSALSCAGNSTARLSHCHGRRRGTRSGPHLRLGQGCAVGN